MFFPSFLHSSLPFFRGSIDFFTQYVLSKLLHLNPELIDKTQYKQGIKAQIFNITEAF